MDQTAFDVDQSQEHLETLKAEILTLRGANAAAPAQMSHRERENNALLEAQVRTSTEQLSKQEDELRRRHSMQRFSDARVGRLTRTA